MNLSKIYRDDEQIFKVLRGYLKGSNCNKTRVGAAIVNGGRIISVGVNRCAPNGHNYSDHIARCPRIKMRTGEHYELCSTVHAEVSACMRIRKGRDFEELEKFAGHLKSDRRTIRGAFSDDELGRLGKSTLYLSGHYYVCKSCSFFLNAVGLKKIKIDMETAERVKESYELRDLE
ncbi:hypothetical protein M1590_00345 [Candidatus Marsarchaeota archaeon]|nr:hypothetical protein [Candidatus Marsarchaeota archaeon]